MAALRPWRDEYQLLCSIDSVSGEMRSISPFQVPNKLKLDDHTATSIESHHKVIETIQDFQESKAFCARLSASHCSWRCEAGSSTLDSAKVNSRDVFAYYALLFTKSRIVVSSSDLSGLQLTREAEKAARSGRFRDTFGDMVVVGYIEGGEAEAVMRVAQFQEEDRSDIRKALRMALQSGFSDGEHKVDLLSTDSGVAASVAANQVSSRALQDATSTILCRRTGVTHKDQLANPNAFPQLLKQLSKAPENKGIKISAVCYRVELFRQVPGEVLGFARTVVEENVSTLQKQFAQVQYVHNSCEAHLAPAGSSAAPDLAQHIRRDTLSLHRSATEAMQRFARFKSYADVGLLPAGEGVRTVGLQLLERWQDLQERMRAEAVREQARRVAANSAAEEAKERRATVAEAAAKGVEQLMFAHQQQQQQHLQHLRLPLSPEGSEGGTGASTPASRCGGTLSGRLVAGRSFQKHGKVFKCDPYAVIKLDKKFIITPHVVKARPNDQFIWGYDFQLEVSANLMADQDATIQMEVYDRLAYNSTDKYLGTVTVPLRHACSQLLGTPYGVAPPSGLLQRSLLDSAPDGRPKQTWYPVEKPETTKYKCRGELLLSFSFAPQAAGALDRASLAGQSSGEPSFSAARPSASYTSGNGGPTTAAASPSHDPLLRQQQQQQQPEQWQGDGGVRHSGGGRVKHVELSQPSSDAAFGVAVGIPAHPLPAAAAASGSGGGAAAAATTASSDQPQDAGLASEPSAAARDAQHHHRAAATTAPIPTPTPGGTPAATATASASASTAAARVLAAVAAAPAGGAPGQAPHGKRKKQRRLGAVGVVLRLGLVGGALAALGTGGVVLARRRYDVDLVQVVGERSRAGWSRAAAWGSGAGRAVGAWAVRLAGKVRSRVARGKGARGGAAVAAAEPVQAAAVVGARAGEKGPMLWR